jgi:2-oxoglutarate dehydrogenase E2 component (dihydrolipoamide succinyltransferase)
MIPIKVPPLGESIVEAIVARWLRDEGDAVAAGDALVELETDKITVEVPALKAGVLVKRSAAEGATVKVDEVIGELDETAAAAGAGVAPQTDAARASASAGLSAATQEKRGEERSATARGGTQRVSPAAQRIAAESGIDTSGIAGSGRGGVVSKPDLVEQAGRAATTRTTPVRQAAVAPQTPAPAAAPSTQTDGRETREKMSTRRRRIAEHLLESQHATAHLTTFNEVDMSAVIRLREKSRARVEKEHGVKLTFMPFFIKAACMALKDIPVVNAMVDNETIVYRHYVNMGIAVAAEQGLVVPNIRDADSRGMIAVAREISALAARARDGKLTMDDLTGGTFTITNGGVFGSLLSTPIVNFPQSGILGLHKIQDRPVAVEGRVEIRPMMYIALSYDHRIVDGQQAVLFLVRVKELMEDPGAMLIDS